jgi:VIT1/CCC1 family predicted Fe2+/Mn2+ transporter
VSEEGSLGPQDRETKRRLPELEAARPKLRGRKSLLPHEGAVNEEQSAEVGKSGSLRAGIFGVNDGLVSNVALIMGFAGADQPKSVILLAGISGLLAGAFSMGAGEYISMKVQREVLERMLHLEAHELHGDPSGERDELAAIYRAKGLSTQLAVILRSRWTRTLAKSSASTRRRGSATRGPRRSRRSSRSASARSFH